MQKSSFGIVSFMYFILIFANVVGAYSVGQNSEVHQYLTNESSLPWGSIPYEIKANLGDTLQTYNDDDDFDEGDGIITGSAEEDYFVNPGWHFWQPDNPNNGEYDD